MESKSSAFYKKIEAWSEPFDETAAFSESQRKGREGNCVIQKIAKEKKRNLLENDWTVRGEIEKHWKENCESTRRIWMKNHGLENGNIVICDWIS